MTADQLNEIKDNFTEEALFYLCEKMDRVATDNNLSAQDMSRVISTVLVECYGTIIGSFLKEKGLDYKYTLDNLTKLQDNFIEYIRVLDNLN